MARTRLLKLGLLALGAAIGCGHSAPVASAADTNPAAGKLTLTASVGTATVAVDPKLAEYKRSSAEVSGAIKSAGSDTMGELMTVWADGFRKFYPNVQAEVEAK